MHQTEKNILGAFFLNLFFALFEFVGGFYIGSIAIISDSFHDLFDSFSIGISYILEKISKKKPDEQYTFGYTRYSTLGAFLTTFILIVGSLIVIYQAIKRIFLPVSIHYEGMIALALIGVLVNLLATYLTKDGDSLNQKSVNLHMLEDVLNWLIVLVGSIVMKFTNFSVLDSLMSIGVSFFILVHALKNMKKIIDLFLNKVPHDISVFEIKKELLKIPSISDIHHLHIWSMDGVNHYATMHVVIKKCNIKTLKKKIKDSLSHYGINHVTLEIEEIGNKCDETECNVKLDNHIHHH